MGTPLDHLPTAVLPIYSHGEHCTCVPCCPCGGLPWLRRCLPPAYASAPASAPASARPPLRGSGLRWSLRWIRARLGAGIPVLRIGTDTRRKENTNNFMSSVEKVTTRIFIITYHIIT